MKGLLDSESPTSPTKKPSKILLNRVAAQKSRENSKIKLKMLIDENKRLKDENEKLKQLVGLPANQSPTANVCFPASSNSIPIQSPLQALFEEMFSSPLTLHQNQHCYNWEPINYDSIISAVGCSPTSKFQLNAEPEVPRTHSSMEL